MKNLKRQLKEYKRKTTAEPEEEKIAETIACGKQAFWDNVGMQTSSYFEFLYEQAGYIRKYLWVIQAAALFLAFRLLEISDSEFVVRRIMGTLAPVFVMITIPELWKNRSSGSMEIEGAAFYSLKQIYAARMFLFAIADVFLLGVFCGGIWGSRGLEIEEIVIQFFLPMVVTCGICFRTLCSKHLNSEFAAISLAGLFMTAWVFVVLHDAVYDSISMPIWIGISGFSVLYFIYTVRKVLKKCESYWEVEVSWN